MRAILLGLTGVGLATALVAGPVVEACSQEGAPRAMARGETVSFAEDIFPIFKGRCIDCHRPGGTGYEASGLDLTSYDGLMAGTKFGSMVVPGDPLTSNLMVLLDWRAAPELRMPHGATRRLSTCDRSAIRTWIREGARDN